MSARAAEDAAGQPLHQEALHHQRGVALEQAHEGQAPVVEVADRGRQRAVHVGVLVLQGVAQLVGEDELVGGREGRSSLTAYRRFFPGRSS